MSFVRRTALIVDNEQGFHEILQIVLEPLGFKIESAYDGEEGLRRYKLGNYDVVFSDVHMPKMQGPQLYAKIRELNPNQPIVMMTSGSDPEGRFEIGIQKTPLTACMYKPFEIDEAVHAVENILGVKLEEAA